MLTLKQLRDDKQAAIARLEEIVKAMELERYEHAQAEKEAAENKENTSSTAVSSPSSVSSLGLKPFFILVLYTTFSIFASI